MTSEHESHIIRTTGRRLGKGIAIILIVIAVGAAINVSFAGEWTKYPPGNQVALKKPAPTPAPVPTGKTVELSLTFIESPDFKTLAFNALPGEEGHNPDIVVNAGDKVILHIKNGGKMPHAFGVVSDPSNPNSIEFKAAFKSPSDPLLSGQEGTLEFTASAEGEYYYICTVPGHADLGMKGKFIVKKAEDAASSGPVAPTGIKETFDLAFIESPDFKTLAFNALPGEEGHNKEIRVRAGTEVTINVKNGGKMPHAFGVVSDPSNPNSIVFSAAIGSASNPLLSGKSDSVTFTANIPGEYYYICTVPGHADLGMKGKFIVE